MKNYVQIGDTVTLAAPYAVLSGQGALVGSFFGVASSDVANGADGEFAVDGVFDLAVLSTDVVTQGQKIYWDNTNKRCTSTASGNSLIGGALTAKASGVSLVRVRLNEVTI